jgi:ribosome-binding protein aMBF1 (putative translation factor)
MHGLAQKAARATRRRGRPQSARTRQRLSVLTFKRHRDAALASDSLHPLRRVRLDRGLTIDALSRKALVAASLIQKLETGAEAGSDLTWATPRAGA